MAGKSSNGKGNNRAMTRPAGSSTDLDTYGEDQDVDFDTAAGQAEDYDEGGTVNKSVLEGVDMVISKVKFRPSNMGDGEFAVVTAVTKEHGKVTFTDSGVGVCKKLREHIAKSEKDEVEPFPLRVRQGLKKNTYTSKVTGKEATTYWLNGGVSNEDAAAMSALGKSSAAKGRAARA